MRASRCGTSCARSCSRCAQRRQRDGIDGQPIVEVLAEAPGLDLRHQVAVGGGDDAHVGVLRAHLADALVAPLLQHAQQLALQLQRQLADLVEEQRAAVGGLEAPHAIARRARKRAAHVAEQLALRQLARDGGAVQLDERAARWRALRWWIARAASSLPVPDSPSTSTVVSVPATAAICWRITRSWSLSPIRSSIGSGSARSPQMLVLDQQLVAHGLDLRERARGRDRGGGVVGDDAQHVDAPRA